MDKSQAESIVCASGGVRLTVLAPPQARRRRQGRGGWLARQAEAGAASRRARALTLCACANLNQNAHKFSTYLIMSYVANTWCG